MKIFYSGKITMDKGDQEQSGLIEYILNFNEGRTKDDDEKNQKKMFLIL